MKKIIFIVVVLVGLIGCSNEKSSKDNLVGRWEVYKYFKNNIDQSTLFADSFPAYTITFDAGGNFTESYLLIDTDTLTPDTTKISGTWAFENKLDNLILTDSVYRTREFTIYNLENTHVELRRSLESRYMTKIQ